MHVNTDRLLISRPAKAPQGTEALGQTHYSYGFAARNFSWMFQQEGVAVETIPFPEQFKSEAFARSLGLREGAYAHLIFRSTEDIRPIAGAYNIAHFAWEFPHLKDETRADEPILDHQTHMLGLCDEIWVGCAYTAGVLTEHGLTKCYVIPSPVFSPALPRPEDPSAAWDQLAYAESLHLVSFSTNFLGTGHEVDLEEDYVRLARRHAKPLGRQHRLQEVIAAKGAVFLSVLNPYDRRKNLANLIEGFLLASAGRSDAVLVVKLATSGVVESPEGYLYHQIRLLFGRPHCVDEDRVIFVGGYLPNDDMTALYHGSDFYLCTSIGEGQNAPLLESMAHGCVPVSVRNTAMADYISDDNAVVIDEGRYAGLLSGLASDVAGKTFEINFCDRYQIGAAIERALALPPEVRGTKRAASLATIAAHYAPDVIYERVLERLQAIDETITRESLIAPITLQGDTTSGPGALSGAPARTPTLA